MFSKAWIIIGAIALVATAAIIVTIVAVIGHESDEEFRRKETSTGAPPPPSFNDGDSQQCRDNILDFYTRADAGWTGTEEGTKKLSDAFAKVLTQQSESGEELVNNEDFLEWTTSDWDSRLYKEWNPDEPKPGFTKEMYRTFLPEKIGKPAAENIRNEEQLNAVINVLF